MTQPAASALAMRDKATELRNQMIDVNPVIPAQVLMAALGGLLIQFSVGQVGPGMTSKFLDDLKEAVRKFGPAQQ